MEINQVLAKALAPCPFNVWHPFWNEQACSYLHCGLQTKPRCWYGAVSDRARLIWPLCGGKDVTHEKVWHVGHIWHPVINGIYHRNILMETENIARSWEGSEEYVTILILLKGPLFPNTENKKHRTSLRFRNRFSVSVWEMVFMSGWLH